MFKVSILVYQNMRYAPFLRIYESVLLRNGINYDIIYLNRCPEINEIQDEKHISIKWTKCFSVKFEKIYNALKYPFAVKKIFKRKQYNFIIVLTTMPAVLLKNYLVKNYKNKYIVDIRDYTKENNSLYFKYEEKVIRGSSLCVISSPGFIDFLPVYDYYIMHNLNNYEKSYSFIKRKANERIRISYIGSIQYTDQCIRMINLVLQDERFEFAFYGNEPIGNVISEYVSGLNSNRIIMHGPFLPSDKEDIYNNSDLIFNCYGNNSLLVQKAISNKYYDGAFYKKPLLVSPNTIMASLSKEYAFALDLDKAKSLDELYNWYINLDANSFIDFTNSLLENSINENNSTINKIEDVLLNYLHETRTK